MLKRILLYTILQVLLLKSYAQQDSLGIRSVNRQRVWIVSGANAFLWTGSFIALNKAWYADYPRAGFHFFNDNKEWNQMDKAGHVWTAYHVARLSSEAWKWTGISSNKAAVLGGVSGMVYQSIIEIQDGYSAEWGFSWGDMASNLAGAGLYVLQERGWKEQRLQIKMSYWPHQYPDGLSGRRDQLFGSSSVERILKDYNAQTYWLSVNLHAFMPGSAIPPWLNISLGYGAGGMLGGRGNKWTDKDGEHLDYTHILRERKFYLSPDIDFTKIRTNRKWLKSAFFVLNMIKIPAPALELKNAGKLKLRAFKF